MPFNLLLLPLVGGYLFLYFFKLTHILAKRLEGQQLIIFSALPATFFLLLSILTTYFGSLLFPRIALAWGKIIPFQYSGTAIISFILGLSLPFILNFFISEEHQLKLIRKLIKRDGEAFEVLVDKAIHEEKQLALTLKNHKVYIGYVTRTFNPFQEKTKFIKLLPTLSGYRDDKTKELHIITSYLEVYKELIKGKHSAIKNLKFDDFEIAIAVSEILSANIFDVNAYYEFNKDKLVT